MCLVCLKLYNLGEEHSGQMIARFDDLHVLHLYSRVFLLCFQFVLHQRCHDYFGYHGYECWDFFL